MKPGLVTVVMPALNEERSIAQAVASVLSQQDVDLELLVADGRSTDGTRAVVSELARQDARIRLLDNSRRTIPGALNIGLSAARGQFLARVDSHATVSADYLARGVSHLRQDDRLAGVGGLRRGVSDEPRGRAVALALSSRFGVGDSLNHYATLYQYADHASFGVYRTELLRRVHGWDESLRVNEDVDLDHRLAATGAALAFDPDMVIYWQVQRTPRSLFRQYRRYGRGKAAMVRKNGLAAVRPRHCAAPLAVAGTAVLAPLTLWRPALLVLFGPYAAALTVASWRAWSRRPDALVHGPSIPASFLAMHFGWGVGFLEALLLRLPPALSSTANPPAPRPRPERVP